MQATGIVHFGSGAFHRAHQAIYTDAAMAAGDRDWAITGVSLRSPATRDALAPQDGLYTVTSRGDLGDRTQVVGSVRNVVVAPEDPEVVTRLIAAPSTSLLTFTVTEKGYALGSPAAKADLRGEGPPSSIYGFLRHGLARRKASGLPGLTLISCDNLSSNGARLRAYVGEFLDEADQSLRIWFEAHCACPSTMVDRIVPAATAADLDATEQILNLRDEGALVTEFFSQWVIQDQFASRRPRWDDAGATFVEDVEIYELAKLRMLNGAHSALAYLGLERGHSLVHEAIEDEFIRAIVTRLMISEAGATLPSAFDAEHYADTLLKRFTNAALPHRLSQIAMDGSQKVPQRWLPLLAERQSAGRPSPATLTALAAWIRHVRGEQDVQDPLAPELKSLWEVTGETGIVDALFGSRGLFSNLWPASPENLRELRGLVARERPNFLDDVVSLQP